MVGTEETELLTDSFAPNAIIIMFMVAFVGIIVAVIGVFNNRSNDKLSKILIVAGLIIMSTSTLALVFGMLGML